MIVKRLDIPDLVLIEPRIFSDDRGSLIEVWVQPRYAELGLPQTFVQDNMSRSAGGVIRGLHLQHPFGQGKLVSVPSGEVFDVSVDVRVGSPTFGRWVGTTLSDANGRQIYVPPGFAHGFCVMSSVAVVCYKCTALYHPEAELGVAYDDPDIGIHWPRADVRVSHKDRTYPRLTNIDRGRLPRYAIPD